uniref:Transmembrane protein n=1 Tax=Steinernema glaseri TaxID=37863 RepID=A0A1I7YGM9_9BILA
MDTCLERFKEELDFWQLDYNNLAPCCSIVPVLPKSARNKEDIQRRFSTVTCGELRRDIHNVLEEPSSSIVAKFYSIFSIIFIFSSVAGTEGSHLSVPSPTVWNDCSLSVKNALSNRVFKVPVRIKLYADATTAHSARVDATVAVEVAYSYLERAYNWFKDFASMLVMVCIALIFIYFGYQNQQKQAKQWAEPDLSQHSSLLHEDSLRNGSKQWATSHKPLFSSTPAETSLSRRFHAGFEEQSSLDRSTGLLSSSGRNLAGSTGDHFLWSTNDAAVSPKVRSMARH